MAERVTVAELVQQSGFVVTMQGAADHLLDNLQTITPPQLASFLQTVVLERDDWRALLTEIDMLAKSGRADFAEQLMGICLQVAREKDDDWLVQWTTNFLGHVYQYLDQVDNAMAAYRTVARLQMALGHTPQAIDSSTSAWVKPIGTKKICPALTKCFGKPSPYTKASAKPSPLSSHEWILPHRGTWCMVTWHALAWR